MVRLSSRPDRRISGVPVTAQRQHIDGELAPAIQHLNTAIAALIDPQRAPLDNGRYTWLDPLLAQLYDAVAGQNVESKSGGPARAPMWADAFDLAHRIDRAVAKWCPEQPSEPQIYPTTSWRLTTLAEHKWRPQDSTHLAEMAAQLEEFAIAIHALLLPEPVVYLDKPCPICSKEWVKRRDNAGELVNQRALSIRGDHGARCASCKTRWQTIGELAILGRMIGYGNHQVVVCE